MFETDRLPSGWAERIRHMDEVWVPTEFAKTIFMEAGVEADRLRVVAEPVDTDFYNVVPQLQGLVVADNDVQSLLTAYLADSTHIFLFVGKFEARKGIDSLLRAYFNEFRDRNKHEPSNVLLVLVTSAYHSSKDFGSQVRAILSADGWSDADLVAAPRFQILTNVAQEHMPLLYNLASAVVSAR